MQGKNRQEEKEYSNRKALIANLERDRKKLEQDRAEAERDLNRCKAVVATQRQRFDKLSKRFSQLMADLGYAGELSMIETKDSNCPYKIEVQLATKFGKRHQKYLK